MSWRDWPIYLKQCREDVDGLLARGGSLTAYRANPTWGVGPMKGSWAWKVERLAEAVHHVPHVIACSSGTTALVTLLKALQRRYPKRYTHCVTSPLTFSATPGAVLLAGLGLTFGDVQRSNCLLENQYPPRKTLVLGVDLFGAQWSDLHEPSVADSCQAAGLPPISDHGTWSFGGMKNAPAGEGGAVYTNDAEVADLCRLEINNAENFGAEYVSGNGAMDEVTACLAWWGLRNVETRNARRQELAGQLNEIITGHPLIYSLPDPMNHAFYQYPLILTGQMNLVSSRLLERGVQCQPGYIQPHLGKYQAFAPYVRKPLPNADWLTREALLLFPQVNPCATDEEIKRLGDNILTVLDTVCHA